MQTITFRVKDNYVENILTILNSLNGLRDKMIDKIEVSKDKNLQFDPYFYERKKHLDKIMKDMDNGIGVLSQDKFDLEMDIFFKKLELEYAD